MRLPYWTHLRTIIDAMHNFFLNMVSHHFRSLLGVDIPTGDQDASNARPQDMLAGESIFAPGGTGKPSHLKKLQVAALKLLCIQKGIIPAGRGSRGPTKAKLVAALTVG